MSNTGRFLLRLMLAAYLIILHIFAVLFIADRYFAGQKFDSAPKVPAVNDPSQQTSVPTPVPIPSNISIAETPAVTLPSPAPPSDVLMIPVAGVKREQLIDTFADARGEGRSHDAIDIMAPAGTPVVAAADGEIVKFWDSDAGGITIYQTSADKRYIYYYAHLQRRADGLKEHDTVKRGTVIGYVGDTGNAGPGNYHLHFSIAITTDPSRYWEGTYIDPFPLLKNGIATP